MERDDVATSADNPPGQPRRIGIFLFDMVEEIDAIGPWEVFAWWTHAYPDDGWEATTFSADGRPVTGDNTLVVHPHHSMEALLGTHPAVAECAVVARPDDRCGEVPVAVVVPRADVDADELIAWVAERVAPHKRLRAVRFADALPRTPAGKILRRLLRDQPSYV
jgi:hypothetical protein